VRPKNHAMHPKAADNLCGIIAEVANSVERITQLEVNWYTDTFISSSNKITVYRLNGKCLDLYRHMVTGILKLPSWADRFSERFVQNSIRGFLKTALDDGQPDTSSLLLREFLSHNDNVKDEQVVYLPIQSLRLAIPEIVIGNVRLLPSSDTLLDQILADTHMTRDTFLSRAAIYTIAEYRVVAEEKRAVERAEEDVRTAMEILIYALSWVLKPNLLLTPGLQNDAVYGQRHVVVRGVAPNEESTVSGSGVGELLEINVEIWEKVRHSGIEVLCRLLSSDSNTEFDKALLRSVHWFALAHQQTNRATRVLALTAALETLLTKPKGSGHIASTVAEGVAFTLRPDYPERKLIKKSVLALYGTRNNISHGSSTDVMVDDLRKLSILTREFLYQMIFARDLFKARQDVADWIEQKRLS